AQGEAGRVEGTDQVLAPVEVDRGLAAQAGVGLGDERARERRPVEAAHPGRGGEAREVERGASPPRHDPLRATRPPPHDPPPHAPHGRPGRFAGSPAGRAAVPASPVPSRARTSSPWSASTRRSAIRTVRCPRTRSGRVSSDPGPTLASVPPAPRGRRTTPRGG